MMTKAGGKSMAQIEIADHIAGCIKKYGDKLAALLELPASLLVDVARNQPIASQVPGVYVILSPLDVRVVYAGKTNDQGHICRRMQDHRSGNASRDLPVMLQHHQDLVQDIDQYQVKWIEIQDPRDRYYFEQFMTGVLRPILNG